MSPQRWVNGQMPSNWSYSRWFHKWTWSVRIPRRLRSNAEVNQDWKMRILCYKEFIASLSHSSHFGWRVLLLCFRHLSQGNYEMSAYLWIPSTAYSAFKMTGSASAVNDPKMSPRPSPRRGSLRREKVSVERKDTDSYSIGSDSRSRSGSMSSVDSSEQLQEGRGKFERVCS